MAILCMHEIMLVLMIQIRGGNVADKKVDLANDISGVADDKDKRWQ